MRNFRGLLALIGVLTALGCRESQEIEVRVEDGEAPEAPLPDEPDPGDTAAPLPDDEPAPGVDNSQGLVKYDRPVVKDLRDSINMADQARRGDAAIDAMLAVACFELNRIGRPDVCDEITGEYERLFAGYLSRMVLAEDLGDHKPLSLWLAVVTETLTLMLGEDVMKWTHLDDLAELNYSIPVVFNPKKESDWCLETSGVDCRDEYRLHFVPFSGVCGYWGAWLTCTVATWGSGMFLVCTPVSMVSEHIVRKYIAPPVSNRVYDWANR